jgi:5-methylcytosine-specific restriction endonuclease McrA
MVRPVHPYGAAYRAARAALLAWAPNCWICGGPGADSADHVPSLYEHRHVAGSGCCVLKPAHRRCNTRRGGWRAAVRVREMRRRARR